MPQETKYPHQATTKLAGLAFAAMRMVMLHQAQENDFPVLENDENGVTLELGHGTYRFTPVEDGIAVAISATQADWLFTLKEGFVEQLAATLPDLAQAVRWSDAPVAGGLPLNFHFAQVRSVTPVGRAFLRVRLTAENLGSFQEDAIHFRLVLPPEGAGEVEWPRVGANGATIWPSGDKALHRPVYTTRRVDPVGGEMEFDVFLHEGGRVTQWAQRCQPGDQVGLVGPGGGGIPATSRIHLFADETGFPAVARIVENLPANVAGSVTLCAAQGADCAYPFECPAGLSLSWITPGDGPSLSDLALTRLEADPEHFLWFAAEKSLTQKVRAAYRAAKRDPKNAYIAAYWS